MQSKDRHIVADINNHEKAGNSPPTDPVGQTEYPCRLMDNVSIRLVKERTLVSKKKIRTPKDAVEIIAQEYKYLDREALFSVNLNTHNQPINFIKIGIAKPHSFMVWGYAIPFFLKKIFLCFKYSILKLNFVKYV